MLIISKGYNIIDNFKKVFHLAEYLEKYNQLHYDELHSR